MIYDEVLTDLLTERLKELDIVLNDEEFQQLKEKEKKLNSSYVYDEFINYYTLMEGQLFEKYSVKIVAE